LQVRICYDIQLGELGLTIGLGGPSLNHMPLLPQIGPNSRPIAVITAISMVNISQHYIIAGLKVEFFHWHDTTLLEISLNQPNQEANSVNCELAPPGEYWNIIFSWRRTAAKRDSGT